MRTLHTLRYHGCKYLLRKLVESVPGTAISGNRRLPQESRRNRKSYQRCCPVRIPERRPGAVEAPPQFRTSVKKELSPPLRKRGTMPAIAHRLQQQGQPKPPKSLTRRPWFPSRSDLAQLRAAEAAEVGHRFAGP